MEEKSADHPALAGINTLRLESSDGTLSCRQKDGNPCTAEQVRSLDEHVAAEMQCNLRFEDRRSNAGNATDSQPAPSSDTAAKVAAWESTLDTTNTSSDSAANEQAPEGTSNAANTTSGSAANKQAPEGTLNTANAASDRAAKERERERIERRKLLSENAAKERERESIERRKSLSESAAKAREQERTEGRNAPPVSAAKARPAGTEQRMTSSSKPAKAPPAGKRQ
jgi:hypothetical protein